MADPFTPKIRKHIKEGIEACQSCAEITRILRAADVPNETIESQNEYQLKVLQKLKELSEEVAAKGS